MDIYLGNHLIPEQKKSPKYLQASRKAEQSYSAIIAVLNKIGNLERFKYLQIT